MPSSQISVEWAERCGPTCSVSTIVLLHESFTTASCGPMTALSLPLWQMSAPHNLVPAPASISLQTTASKCEQRSEAVPFLRTHCLHISSPSFPFLQQSRSTVSHHRILFLVRRLDLLFSAHAMTFKTNSVLSFTLLALTVSLPAFADHPPFATHYHDCCRPAFSYDHPAAHTYAPVDFCAKDGLTVIPQSQTLSGRSGCDGGTQFPCACIQPWVDTVDPSLAYGYGAYNIHQPDGSIESACYLVNFKPTDQQGKPMKVTKMILQNINVSGGVGPASWDMALMGGVVGDRGINKGCVNQWGQAWGNTFGGVAKEEDCCKMPVELRASCLFRFTVFGNNPSIVGESKRVRCPVGIIDRSGSQRMDDANTPAYTGKTDRTGTPAPDKYQRQRGVCSNLDPLGVVTQVCGGRMPKGSGMVRADGAGAVDGSEGSVGAGAGAGMGASTTLGGGGGLGGGAALGGGSEGSAPAPGGGGGWAGAGSSPGASMAASPGLGAGLGAGVSGAAPGAGPEPYHPGPGGGSKGAGALPGKGGAPGAGSPGAKHAPGGSQSSKPLSGLGAFSGLFRPGGMPFGLGLGALNKPRSLDKIHHHNHNHRRTCGH